jgi:hypothetical protein
MVMGMMIFQGGEWWLHLAPKQGVCGIDENTQAALRVASGLVSSCPHERIPQDQCRCAASQAPDAGRQTDGVAGTA